MTSSLEGEGVNQSMTNEDMMAEGVWRGKEKMTYILFYQNIEANSKSKCFSKPILMLIMERVSERN